MKPRDIFLRSLQRQETPRPATGSATSMVTTDLMEKAGIFFPDAHCNAEAMAGLAALGHTELGFDDVMPLFSVWHESAALGCKVEWGNKNRMPDCGSHPFRLGDEVRIPGDLLTRPEICVPLRAIEILQATVGDTAAVVGKIFGPWTLGYHLFGVEDFLVGTMLDPDSVRKALDKLKEVTVQFGKAQLDAGADALTLADHATRDLCSPDAYRDFLLPLHRELKERLGCPIILHICGDTADRIGYIGQTGIDCFHFDSKVPCATARKLAGDKLALMGGTSNFNVVLAGNEDAIKKDVEEKIANHIDVIGPECAVPLNAPCNNLKTLARIAKG